MKTGRVPILMSMLLIMAVVAMALAGCGDGEASPSPTASPSSVATVTQQPTATPTQEASEPVVLRVGTTKPFKTTNKFGDYWYGVLVNMTTHDPLVKLGADMQPTPWLATDWEISEDSKQFVFTIADNAMWHDGQPLTAEDVRWSIEYYRDKDPQAGWMEGVIETVEADGNQVTLNLSSPYGNLLTEFMTYAPVPKHIWENVEDPLTYEGADRVIGSGPFELESWDATAGRFVFVANEDYFQGKPNIDRLEIEVFSNMDALVMALADGQIDVWWDYSGEFPYTHVPTLLKEEDIEFASATFLGVPSAIGFNMDRYPMSELAFRQAVAKAIDYEQIADLIYYGYGTVPTYGFVPSTHPNFDESIPSLSYDAAGAESLLDSAGITDSDGDGLREDLQGNNLKLTLLVRSDLTSIVRCAELVQQQLEDIGIDTQIKAVDSSTWVATKDEMDYDIVFFRATPWGTLMHAGHGSGYFDSRRTGAGVLHNLEEQEYLDTCDERLATAQPNEQRELDLEIQELHEEYLPGIALVWIESVYPYNEEWQNWVIDHIYGGPVNSFSWFTVTKK